MKDAKISCKQTSPSVIVDLRIPGRWAHPREVIERLPDSCRVTPRGVILPDGARIDLGFLPPDEQFPKIFRSSCRYPPTEHELAIANGYAFNVTLSGSGGSIEAARTLMRAAAIIVRAGGAGVFIDNSLLAHGGGLWLEMAEDGCLEALSFAFVGIVQSNADIWTAGMHVLGLRDIVLKRTEVEQGSDVADLVLSMVREDKKITNGHIVAGANGSWFSCRVESGDPGKLCAPVRNPFGRLRLTRLRHAERKKQEAAMVLH